jgi:hypothetical protein
MQQVQLTAQADTISRRFTANAKYLEKSAYIAQFIGSFSDQDWKSV